MIGQEQAMAWQDPVTVYSAVVGDTSEHSLDLSSYVDADAAGVVLALTCSSHNQYTRITDVHISPYSGGTANTRDIRFYQYGGGIGFFYLPQTVLMPIAPNKTIYFKDAYYNSGSYDYALTIKVIGQVKYVGRGMMPSFTLRPISATDSLVLNNGTATSWTTVSSSYPDAIGFISQIGMNRTGPSPDTNWVYYRPNSSWADSIAGKVWAYNGTYFYTPLIIPADQGSIDYRISNGGASSSHVTSIWHTYAIAPADKSSLAPKYNINAWLTTKETVLLNGTATDWTTLTITSGAPGALAVLQVTGDTSSNIPGAYVREMITDDHSPQIVMSAAGSDATDQATTACFVRLDSSGRFQYKAYSNNQVSIKLIGQYLPI